MIQPIHSDDGSYTTTPGTISAAYQNFLICIEMFFAAIALRYAFPISAYLTESAAGGRSSGGVTMQSISSTLRETMNPRDIMTDAIHNFHPQYQQYTQYSSGGNRHKKTEHYGEVNTQEDTNDTTKTGNTMNITPTNGSAIMNAQTGQGMPSKVTKVKNNEKTLLLSSDDEFQ